jgi:cell division protein FtsQ
MSLWHDTRLLHASANGLLALLLAAVLGAGAWWLVQRPVFTLRAVSIEPAAGEALHHVSSPLLRNSAARRAAGNFFTIDLEDVRAGFETVPWVRRATVRRIWPNRLVVSIEEHRPLALWGDGRLVNTYGELYSANLAEAEEDGPLPQFSGPAGSQQQVVTRWEELHRWLSPLGLRPAALHLSPRYAWTARLDDGTVLLLGRDQGLPIEERVRRWVTAYPRVKARLERRAEVVDLRYPNGFAVRSVAALAAGAPASRQPPEALIDAAHGE